MKLSKEEAIGFVEQMYLHTNPAKPHEETAIANILQLKTPLHGWRFRNHVFCKGCQREIPVLDQFLSGLAHHSPEYVRAYVEGQSSPGGNLVFEAADGLPAIQVFDHSLAYVCLACGVLNESANPLGCDYYFYQRPRKPFNVISMSRYWYERVLSNLSKIKSSTAHLSKPS